jgi:DNA-binding beta-propeller fold protein YncE
MKYLVGVLILVALGGCTEEQKPLDGRCVAQPSHLDFGSVFPPQSSAIQERVTRTITIRNSPERTSAAGNEDVVGTVLFILDAPQTNPPEFHLIPKNTDPRFVVPAWESKEYEIEALILSTTSTGEYAGELDLGSQCPMITYRLHVAAREEPPPDFLLEWGGQGSGSGQLLFPYAIATDPDGYVYVLDRGNVRVQKFDLQGNLLRQWYEWDELDADEGLTTFYIPVGISVDDDGFVYVSDREPEHMADRITKFDGEGNYIKRIGPLHGGGSIFGRAWHLDVDGEGVIHILDTVNFRIQKLRLKEQAPGYDVLAEWGAEGNTPGRFVQPFGVAVDRQTGSIYVSDVFLHKVQKFDENGRFLLQWGREGSGPGQFRRPSGLTVDGDGHVYVADNANTRIQKFDENGSFLTEWGIPGVSPGEIADPLDVAVDHVGDVHILDSNTHRVSKFGASGS